MNLILALGLGLVAGAVSVAGLWFSLRQVIGKSRPATWLAASQICRLAGCAALLVALSRQGLGPILAALGGYWMARGQLIRHLGSAKHGG